MASGCGWGQTGKVTFGGMVFQESRVPWNEINPAMVYLDGNPLEQFFHAGDYPYTDPVTQKLLTFHCEEGAKVPEISREIEICADAGGIYIDGNLHKWEDLVDEDGFPYTEVGAHGGDWTLEYGSAKLTFTIGMDAQSTSDMAKVINSMKTGPIIYKWTCDYAGTGAEKAVDATVGKESILITSDLANQCADEAALKAKCTYIVHAGEFEPGKRGIWLADKATDTPIADSFCSWGDMGITPWSTGEPYDPSTPDVIDPDWDHGAGISKKFTYVYEDPDTNGNSADETGVSFTFELSDVTSEYSVIDGLDGMEITPGSVRTDYSLPATYVKPPNDTNVLHLASSSWTSVSYDQEKALGRDFGQKSCDVGSNSNLVYDGAAQEVSWKVSSSSGDIDVKGATNVTEQKLQDDVLSYLKKMEAAVAAKKAAALITGTPSTTPKTLDQVVGTGNITTAGYFNDTFIVDKSAMGVTRNDVVDGKEYHNAFIDFGAVPDIVDLIGTGFDTTCATCSNHYSIQFVDSLSGADVTDSPSGYQYKRTSSGNNHLLEIDISSLQSNGVTPDKLADAIVEIASDKQGFDFHYTQYASEGSKLYVFDNRSLDEIDEKRATFYTVPWDAESMKTYSFGLSSTDGKSGLSLTYEYNFGDATDYIQVREVELASGQFVKTTENPPRYYRPDDPAVKNKNVVASGGAVISNFDPDDPAHMSNVLRYDIESYYTDGTTECTREEAAEAYAKVAVNKMLSNTQTTLHANDYSRLNINGDEKDNQAITTLFDSNLDVDDSGAVMLIQCSGKEDDDVIIPRYAINAGILRMSKASGMSQEQAEMTLRNVDRGLKWLSGVRTTYGGYQNRLEHTYANNMNTAENTQAAESQIRDTDMAKEMVQQSAQNILLQANQAMLAQTMKSSDWILQLLG